MIFDMLQKSDDEHKVEPSDNNTNNTQYSRTTTSIHATIQTIRATHAVLP